MTRLNDLNISLAKKLPSIIQAETTECGICCLAMISSYHGYHLSASEARALFQPSLKGTTLKQLLQNARKLNLAGRAVKVEIEHLYNIKTPCILHWNFNHFVVLKAVHKKNIEIHDPAHGHQVVSFKEVSSSFTGIALELWPDTDFKTSSPNPRIKLRDLVGSVSGIKSALAHLVVLSLALETLVLLAPFYLQWTIDNVIVSEDRDLLTTIALGFIISIAIQVLLGAARSWTTMHLSTTFSVQWQSNIFSHLLRLPNSYYEKRHIGDVVSRFGSLSSIQQTLTGSFLAALIDGLMAVATLGMMIMWSFKLASISMIAMLLYLIGKAALNQAERAGTNELIIKSAKQQTHFLETVRGIKTLKQFQRQDDRKHAWLALLINQLNAGLKIQKIQILAQQSNKLLFGLENIFAIWLGALIVIDGQLTVGALIAYNAYRLQFNNRLSSVIDKFFEIKLLKVHSERVADIALQDPEPLDGGDSQYESSNISSKISLRNISFKFSEHEEYIINNLSLEVVEGESLAIAGKSGGGKTTLINLLAGAYEATSGSIEIGGIDTRKMGLSKLRNMIGTVMQDDALFAGSIQDNITFFDPNTDYDWLAKCASWASIDEDIATMPMGFHTLVGDMGTVLSGGQKQRVLLARALYRRPKILLLDEATSHLDIFSESKVNNAIKSLKITRIIVAHRPETLMSAQKVVILEDGCISKTIIARDFTPELLRQAGKS